MTEDEASKLCCPFYEQHEMCITSRCMMWTWAKPIPVYEVDGTQVDEIHEGDCGLKQTHR